MAIGLGIVLIVLQWPIQLTAFSLLSGSESVELIAVQYFEIRIWGAPATLATFALMGLLIGLGNSRQLLVVQLFLNGLNVGLDIWFAGVLGWGAPGIALGTVLAEWSTVAFAGILIYRELENRKSPQEPFWPQAKIFDRAILLKTLSANANIMVRTLLLVFSFAFFINQSARFGDVALAANHILLQLVSFAAFFLDGYAFVAESLVGSSIGARRLDSFDLTVKRSTILALITAILLALWVFLFGDLAVSLLTDITEVRVAASDLLIFVAAYVLLSFAAFQLDGIFIGASFTAQMRNAAFMSLLVFIAAWWLLIERFGINGLWSAMIIYVAARAGALLVYFSSLRESIANRRHPLSETDRLDRA
jgi:MATE family multidrug resistance protein